MNKRLEEHETIRYEIITLEEDECMIAYYKGVLSNMIFGQPNTKTIITIVKDISTDEISFCDITVNGLFTVSLFYVDKYEIEKK